MIAWLAASVPVVSAAEQTPSQPGLSESLSNGDLSGAFRMTLALAEANDLEAQRNLALFYWHGIGATQNYDEAIKWCTMAAIRGHKKAEAARKLMLEAIDPQIVKKAMEWARKRLEKDAQDGDDTALRPLSTSYLAAFGAPNNAEAYFWATIAVSTGKADARRQRDTIVPTMTQGDIGKAQQRANDWFNRYRKTQS